jgi:hypothetical protein
VSPTLTAVKSRSRPGLTWARIGFSANSRPWSAPARSAQPQAYAANGAQLSPPSVGSH